MASNLTQQAGNDTLVGWATGGNDRGTLDIIYSSAATVILCIWVSTYPNVPGPNDRWYHQLLDKVNLAMIGALGPDLLLGLALGQWSSARRSVQDFRREYPTRGWTITHGFYADMGGFRIVSDADGCDIPANAEQLLYLIKNGHVEMPTLTQQDIKLRSSSDSFSKMIVLWQVFVFLAKEVTRLAQGLPITTLELTAFIYAFMMVAISIAWFQKPQLAAGTHLKLQGGKSFDDVRNCARNSTHHDMQDTWYDTPLDFIWRRGSFATDKHWQYLSYVSHKAHLPLFTRLPGRPWERMPSDIWYRLSGFLIPIGLIIQIPFCLSFLVAWDFHFASPLERLLWRVCATYHAVYSFIITMYCLYSLTQNEIAAISQCLSSFMGRWSVPSPLAPSQHPTLSADITDSSLPSPTVQETLSHHTTMEERSISRMEKPKQRLREHLQLWRNLSPGQDPEQNVALRWTSVLFVLTFIYILSHLFIYLEDFLSLRSQPADVYVENNSYFPLIS